MQELTHEYIDLVKRLEENDDFKILRRLVLPSHYTDLNEEETKKGLIIDIETTGLNTQEDSIIELGMVTFTYGLISGNVFEVQEAISLFEYPGKPIPKNIVALTGITDEMVEWQGFDNQLIKSYFDEASLIIAHNATFDRPFIEKRFEFAASKPWACSLKEVPWESFGYKCTKLGCLLSVKCGVFFDGHRAGNDCAALLHLLATPFEDGSLPMKILLDSARQPTTRIRAVGSSYDKKDNLKARGYNWDVGDDKRPRAWWIDVPVTDEKAEIEWLRNSIYGGRQGDWQVIKMTAQNRYLNG